MQSRKAVVLSARNRNTDRAFLRPVFFYARVFTHGQKNGDILAAQAFFSAK